MHKLAGFSHVSGSNRNFETILIGIITAQAASFGEVMQIFFFFFPGDCCLHIVCTKW